MGLIKHMATGALTGLLCFALGIVLHSCTAEPVEAAAPSLEKAAELAAKAEIVKITAEYEAMSTSEKMEGIVYE